MARRKRSTYKTYAARNLFLRFRVLFIIIVLLIVLGAFFAAYKLFIEEKPQEEVAEGYEIMTAPTLPLVYMMYGTREVNILHGYTAPMDAGYVRDCLYVIDDSYEIPLKIDTFGKGLSAVSFRLFDPDTGNMVQSSDIEEYSSKEGLITCSAKVDTIIEDGYDYLMDVIVKDITEKDIHYYLRVKKDTETTLAEQLEMAVHFNSCIYKSGDSDATAYVAKFLQQDSLKEGNRTYGSANINSATSHVMWGRMGVNAPEDVQIQILDSDGDIGYFRLNYTVSRDLADVTEYYRVSDYYRIRVSDEYHYLLDFERSADQVFIPSSGTIGAHSAALGVVNNKDKPVMSNKEGNISCFVDNNTVWAMDTDRKAIRRIFTFSTGLDDIRSNYAQHDFRLINVSDEGDVQFLIYGYMNAGLHEGRSGIGIYTYISETNMVTENMFIPTDLPFDILQNSIGHICYLSDSGNMYLMIDENLYKMDMNEQTAEVVASGLKEGNYMVHSGGRFLAWQEDGKINNAGKIYLLDMKSDVTQVITAGSGSSIKVMGFLGQDLVYGQGKTGEIYTAMDGTEYLLMTKMFAVSGNNVQAEYDSGADYYYDSTDEYNRVVVNQVRKTGPVYAAAEDFTLFASDEDEHSELEIYVEDDETKKLIYYVIFADSTTSAGDPVIEESENVLFTDENTIDINDMITVDGRYYIYARGHVQVVEGTLADAIITTYEQGGILIDDEGQIFYRRGLLPGSVSISNIAIERAIEKYSRDEMIDVTGIALIEAIYYIGNRIPLAWDYDGDTYIITGYDYSDNLFMTNTDTGEEIVLMYDYVMRIFETSGKCYVIK